MKVPAAAAHEDHALRLAAEEGLLSTPEVAAPVIPTVVLTLLARARRLIRAGRGVYSLRGAPMSARRPLAEVRLHAPREVICLLTALRVHGIGNIMRPYIEALAA